MIRSIHIKNYRSIRDLYMPFSELNALIGPNNAGKSNIIKALNLIIGSSFPSVRSFEENDFWNHQTDTPICIIVNFDRPLNCNQNVFGFYLTFDGNTPDFFALDVRGEILRYYNGKEIRVSNEMKDEVSLMYLGLDRQAYQQIKATKWTIYGKLLKHIEMQIDDDTRLTIKNSFEDTYRVQVSPHLVELENCLKEFTYEQTGMDLFFRLTSIDPISIFKGIRPLLKELGCEKEFDSEDHGAGAQSAVSIAIARAYANIVKKPLLLAIEEPELYLHPQGCRSFYNLLKGLSEQGIQIIYSTHERSFIDVQSINNIHIIKKRNGESSLVSGIDFQPQFHDLTKIASKFDDRLNELFFADKIILVEGSADLIALKFAFLKERVDIDRENISILEVSGRDSMVDFIEIANHFGISCYLLLDADPGDQATQRATERIESIVDSSVIFKQAPKLEGFFNYPHKKFTKPGALLFFSNWYENNSVPDLYKNLISTVIAS